MLFRLIRGNWPILRTFWRREAEVAVNPNVRAVIEVGQRLFGVPVFVPRLEIGIHLAEAQIGFALLAKLFGTTEHGSQDRLIKGLQSQIHFCKLDRSGEHTLIECVEIDARLNPEASNGLI